MTAVDNRSKSASGGALREEPPPRRSYLLFAGQHGTPGGLRDYVALLHDETAARRAFTDIRLSSNHPAAWAELGRVDSSGKLSILCWFGHDRPRQGTSQADPPNALVRRRPFRRRRAEH